MQTRAFSRGKVAGLTDLPDSLRYLFKGGAENLATEKPEGVLLKVNLQTRTGEFRMKL